MIHKPKAAGTVRHPQMCGTPYIRPHRATEFCTDIGESFKGLPRPRPRRRLSGKIFVVRMRTRDLFAVASLLVQQNFTEKNRHAIINAFRLSYDR